MPELVLSATTARRLAITRQRLDGSGQPVPDLILETVRDLGCLQLDPTAVVAPSHHLVLWSRLPGYQRSDLDRLLWAERRLFEYWAHAASIVVTEDYPLHRRRMRSILSDGSTRARRVGAWMDANATLKRSVLRTIRRSGPLLSRQLEDTATVPWRSTGWTAGRNVDRMLFWLWLSGEIMVAGRSGGQRLWDLAGRVLPAGVPRTALPWRLVVHRAAERSLRALGVATPTQIANHFIRGDYPGLAAVLGRLEREGRIIRCAITDQGQRWPGTWYLHAEDVALAERIAGGDWSGRTTLLSPFDNLIADRTRTLRVFEFDYRLEIYVPAPQRRFGYFAMPILQQDRLVGTVDAARNPMSGTLHIKSAYLRAGTAVDASALGQVLRHLAGFVGATGVDGVRTLPQLVRRAIA